MKLRQSIYLSAAAAVAVLLTACGGGSSPNPPNPPSISVAFNPQAPGTLDTSTTANLTAIVSNDGKNGGVKWSVSCSGSQCGSFSAASTASGVATVYTAPAAAPSPAMVTITATSVSDTTKSASATISITTPSAPISVALNPQPPASLAAGTPASFAAVVSNDGANAGVTWTVTCGGAQCGSFSPSTTPSATATTYTAPAVPPTPATVTVTATSVTDTTKSASASIAITGPPPILADGNYVYHLAGEDPSDLYFVAGAFTVQNGVITGGEQDYMDNGGGGANDTLIPSGSSLSTANGNVQIVLNTGDPNVGVNGVETLRGAIVSNSRLLISEFDSFATASGSLDLQTSTAAPAGGYAFNLGGYDGLSPQNNLAVGGIINISGASISVGGSVLDYNDGGSVAQEQSFASGTVSAPDSFGRLTLTLNPSANAGIPSFAVAGYIVSVNQIQLVETNDSLNGDLGGQALGQGSNTGQFNQAAVAGASYAFGAQGIDGVGIVQMAGGFGLNANGTVSGAMAINDLSLHNGAQITSGTYTVDPTGRVTLSVVATVTPVNAPAFSLPYTFQLYLDGNGNALELGVDNTQVTSGLSYLQTASSADFEGTYALGVFGFVDINHEPAWSAVGPVTVASDTFSGFTDYSVQIDANGNYNSVSVVTPGVSLSGSEDSLNGLLSLTGLNAQSVQATSGFGYYPIDNRRVLAIEIDGQQMGLMMLEGTQPN